MNYKYITTPIYYANDKPHIGHAYTNIIGDILAIFYRINGDNVKFTTGTDEHGQKIEKAAKDLGMDPKSFVDQVSLSFRELNTKLKLTNDDFIRTTDIRHIKTAKIIWKKIRKNNNIYLGEYAGWYCVRDESFYHESELVNGLSPTGSVVKWIKEKSYFFNLSKWQNKLLTYYKTNPKSISPVSRYNEVIKFIESGLRDLSISRTSFKWGIPIPNGRPHIMYVWLDALTNYLSLIDFPNADYGQYWKNVIHLIGKDILIFHAVYWPAFLMAADIEPPKSIFAHGWWTVNGEKMSKSVGNVIDPIELVAKYGNDAFRYFLIKEFPLGQDGDFSEEALVTRANADLSNTFGNLCQRVLSFIEKNCNSVIPQCTYLENSDSDLLNASLNLVYQLESNINSFQLHKYVENIWQLIHACNKYVDVNKPWVIKNSDLDRMNSVLFVLAEIIKRIAIMAMPIIPNACTKLLNILNIDHKSINFTTSFKSFMGGEKINKVEQLFPRF